jgi:uncharacterized protein (TIGR00296 family)
LPPEETSQLTERSLSLAEGKTLIHLARLAITTYLESNQIIKPPQDTAERLFKKSGVFITLNRTRPTHELRGCIGFPYPEEPLVKATIKAAICAATDDPRFGPISLDELKHSIVLELTALSEPRLLNSTDRVSFPNLIKIGQHGLMVAGKGRSGLLLPQVAAEWNWDGSEFLMNCCIKAGLPPDSWLLDGVEVKVFKGEIFEEVVPAGEVRRKALAEDEAT